MATIFVRHSVGDFALWKHAFDQQEAKRREFGFLSHSVHRDVAQPRMIIVALRANSAHKAREFRDSWTRQTALDLVMVEGEADVWLGEDIEAKSYDAEFVPIAGQ